MQSKYRIFTSILAAFVFLPALCWGISIRGTVRCLGNPIERVRIYGSGGGGITLTGQDGTYVINVPSAGTYDITPFLYGPLMPEPARKTIRVTNADVTGVDFDLLPLEDSGLSMLSGRIVGRKGPLENVSVRLSGVGIEQTDRNGIYYIFNVKPGRYYLSAYNRDDALLPSVREVFLRNERNLKLNFNSLPLAAPGTYTNSFAGLWNISLRATSNNCQGIPSSLDGQAILSQRGSKVYVQIPRFGNYTVKAKDKAFSGVNVFRRSFCSIQSSLEGTFSDDNTRGTLSGSADASCIFSSPCHVEYTGGLKRK